MDTRTDAARETSRRDLLIALGGGAAFLGLYLRTLCPTVYLGDSGEICGAIATGGIIHPPGYPFFSLLGRLALLVVPHGEPAYRVGCLVALCAAAAVTALYVLIRELGCPAWAAAAAAAAYGVGYTFWNQSTRVEVYSLHVLLACLMLLFGLRYSRTGRLGDLAMAALAGSLGLAHHLTIVLLGPGLLLVCGRRLWTDPGPGRRAVLVGALLLICPALYLLLLVWARVEPPQCWGRPVTLPLLWNHASARIYHGALRLPDWGYFSARARETGSLFVDNFAWLPLQAPGRGSPVLHPLLRAATALSLPAVGAWALWQQNRRIAAGFLLAALAVTAYNQCYHIEDITPYFLTAFLVSAALLGFGLDWAGKRLPGPRLQRVVSCAALVLLPGMPLLRNWTACDLSRATWVRDFARQKLESADRDSLLITRREPDTFPITYVRSVLRIRPDVLPIDYGLIRVALTRYQRDPSLWYLHQLRRQGVRVPLEVPADPALRTRLGMQDYLLLRLLKEMPERPVCTTFLSAANGLELPLFQWIRRSYTILPVGLVLRLQPHGRPVDMAALLRENSRLWGEIHPPDLHGVRVDEEMYPDYVLHHYACMMVNFGGLYERAGELRRARELYRRAVELAPNYPPAASALASLQRGGPAQAAARG